MTASLFSASMFLNPMALSTATSRSMASTVPRMLPRPPKMLVPPSTTAVIAISSPAMQAFYRDNPNYKVALDQLKYAQRFPFSPALFEIQREVIQPNLEAAVLGIKTSAEIMQAAEAKANEILSK